MQQFSMFESDADQNGHIHPKKLCESAYEITSDGRMRFFSRPTSTHSPALLSSLNMMINNSLIEFSIEVGILIREMLNTISLA
jgi:hypothetical protein